MHWRYLKYIFWHKWYCLKACFQLAVFWPTAKLRVLGILHDWSKFRPSEWVSYAEHFYGDGRSLDYAWLKHIHRNKHHWQYWLLKRDNGDFIALDMPARYVIEMAADWYAAGMAIAGRRSITPWYVQNRDKIILSDRTRIILETVIKNFDLRTGPI